MAQIHYGRGYVYSIQYHMVWCVKYRHKILSDKIQQTLVELLHKIATERGKFICVKSIQISFIS